MKRKKKSTKAQSIVGTATSTSSLGAVLSVRNIAKACEFYQEILGFQLQFTLPRTDGELRLAVLKAGTSTLLLGRLDELHYEHETRARLIRKGPHGLGITLTLLVPEVDKIYAAARKARAEILLEPTDEFYGDRVFMFVDPDGYEWKISQTIKIVSPEEITKIDFQI